MGTDWEDRLMDTSLQQLYDEPPDLSTQLLQAYDTKERKSKVTRFGLVAAMAASIILVGSLLLSALPAAPGELDLSGSYVVENDQPLKRGSTVITTDSEATLAIGEHSETTIAANSRVTVDGITGDDRLYLTYGKITSHVTPSGDFFRVNTDVGEVLVTGTQFSVELIPPQETNMFSKMIVAVMTGAVLVSGPFGSETVQAGEEKSFTKRSGVIEGLLLEKGKNWIRVREDGKEESVKYQPVWKGGMPKDGGRHDKSVLEKIKHVAAPNRVRIKYKVEEGPRVLDIKVLKPASKGTMRGTVSAKGEKWFELTSKKGINRFSPRWSGGMPKDGGGLDKAMLETIRELKVGSEVSVSYVYDERLRAVKVK